MLQLPVVTPAIFGQPSPRDELFKVTGNLRSFHLDAQIFSIISVFIRASDSVIVQTSLISVLKIFNEPDEFLRTDYHMKRQQRLF